MPVKPPSAAQVTEIATRFGLSLTPAEAADYAAVMVGMSASVSALETMPEPKLPVKYPRTPGRKPSADENPLNAWYWKSEIKGAVDGPLAGKRIAVKDTIAVAGVPMQNGSALIEGFVPDVDATVVTRILDAGGTIVGKAACTDLSFDGHGQDTKGGGKNPHNPAYGAGGSSSGSAALLETGEADITIGGDQAGSIRIPSSWCGVYGLKPTHGLVPFTAVMGNDMTLDTIGPMGRTVGEVALLLSVIAGPDGYDPRQGGIVKDDYLSGLEAGVEGLRIGIMGEGFGHGDGAIGRSDPRVDEKVKAAAERFRQGGVQLGDASVPMHGFGMNIWMGVGVEGSTNRMVKLNGMGTNWQGYYDTALLDAYAGARLTRPEDFADTVKLTMFMGEYLGQHYHGRYYAKAQNLRRNLRASYDAALVDNDLLLLPTTPMAAQKFADGPESIAAYFDRSWEMLGNTAPTSLTGHPAINIPCGMIDGLPVGMMLVGRHGEDALVLRAARAFEQLGDWKQW